MDTLSSGLGPSVVVLHADDVGSVAHRDRFSPRAERIELGPQPALVPHQDHLHPARPHGGQYALHLDPRRAVGSHRVDCYPGHEATLTPAPLLWAR